MDFNLDWQFCLENHTNGHLKDFDESSFRPVDLPHDFSVDLPFDGEEGTGNTGYKLGGIAWYRKHFEATKEMLQGKVFVEFDGIYNRSTIYSNEKYMTFHPYGYSPCLLDISDTLLEGDNVLAVKVDHSRYADSRWYTGSGIYRKVKLHVLPKHYISVYGVKITTPTVSKEEATVKVAVELGNTSPDLSVMVKLFDPKGKEVAVGESQKEIQSFTIKNPELWGIFQGDLYSAEVSLKKNGKVIQTRTESFGIRFFHFDTDKGFFLNGEHQYIKGVCLHHDGGLVGAAVPKDVWRRRLLTLKEGGCNAIRTAHNPFSADFMDLCDELGFLVQEEFYDEWDNPKDKRLNRWEQEVDFISRGHHEFFQEYAKDDLQIVVHRDFNHPCIFQWSIGNEIEWTYDKYVYATGYFNAEASGNYFWEEPPYTVEQIRENVSKLPKEKYEVGETAKKLATWTREIDDTRPVIANMILPSASYESGFADPLDMVGFSYRRVVYDRCHSNYPDKPIMGTENVAQWHEWKAVLERPFISGIFLWTGIDYLGEACIKDFSFPLKSSSSGILDLAGFPKVPFYLYRSLWDDKANSHMMTQVLADSIYDKDANGNLVEKEGKAWDRRLWRWEPRNHHWNYEKGQEIVVEAISNEPSLTLYLNDKEISTLRLENLPDRMYKWVLPYEEGTLKVKGASTEECICTAEAGTQVVLSPDKTNISCDYDEAVHIVGQLQDKNGNPVTFAEETVEFVVEGSPRLHGVDNGSNSFVGDHKHLSILSKEGRVMIVLGGTVAETMKISAKVKGNTSNTVEIVVG